MTQRLVWFWLLSASLAGATDNEATTHAEQTAPASGKPSCPTGTMSPVPGERHGAWMANVDSDCFDSREKIRQCLTRLKALGITEVYPVIWNKGVLMFDSHLEGKLGISPYEKKEWKHRDALKETIAEAHKLGLDVYPWFEAGFRMPASMKLFEKHPDWFTKNRDDQTVIDYWGVKMVNLNPFHPEVQKFLIHLAESAVYRHTAGFQIDDNFTSGKDLGYDDYTQGLYQQEKGRKPPRSPESSTKEEWSEWTRWKAERLTKFVQDLSAAVRKKGGKKYRFQVSPNPYPWSYDNYAQDWPEYIRSGAAQDLLPQLYRTDLKAFMRELSTEAMGDARKCVQVMPGILAGLRTKPVTGDAMAEQVIKTREAGYPGMAFFHASTLLENGVEPTEARARKIAEALQPSRQK